MKRVSKPPAFLLRLSAMFFVIVLLEVTAAALLPESLMFWPLLAAVFLTWQSGKAWSLWWRWRESYHEYQEWSKK